MFQTEFYEYIIGQISKDKTRRVYFVTHKKQLLGRFIKHDYTVFGRNG